MQCAALPRSIWLPAPTRARMPGGYPWDVAQADASQGLLGITIAEADGARGHADGCGDRDRGGCRGLPAQRRRGAGRQLRADRVPQNTALSREAEFLKKAAVGREAWIAVGMTEPEAALQ